MRAPPNVAAPPEPAADAGLEQVWIERRTPHSGPWCDELHHFKEDLPGCDDWLSAHGKGD